MSVQQFLKNKVERDVIKGHDGQVVKKNILNGKYYFVNSDKKEMEFQKEFYGNKFDKKYNLIDIEKTKEIENITLGPNGTYLLDVKVMCKRGIETRGVVLNKEGKIVAKCMESSHVEAKKNGSILFESYEHHINKYWSLEVDKKVEAVYGVGTNRAQKIKIEDGKFLYKIEGTSQPVTINGEKIGKENKYVKSHKYEYEEICSIYDEASRILNLHKDTQDAAEELTQPHKYVLKNVEAYILNNIANETEKINPISEYDQVIPGIENDIFEYEFMSIE